MSHDQPDSEIPAEELAALRAMENLSDDALWQTAREQMPADVQARMTVLMTRNNLVPSQSPNTPNSQRW
jgi:hypothetical protein